MLMIGILMINVLASVASPQIGMCDPPGQRLHWTREQRQETKRRVLSTFRARGASRQVLAFMKVVGMRESAWRPGVRHTLGERENGAGALGINVRPHRDKWPGAMVPAMCLPEASALVAQDIIDRAQRRWGAKNLVEVNAVYAGRFQCVHEDGRRECWIGHDLEKDRGFCRRLESYGVDCRAPLPPRAAGRLVPVKDRPAVAAELAETWSGR